MQVQTVQTKALYSASIHTYTEDLSTYVNIYNNFRESPKLWFYLDKFTENRDTYNNFNVTIV